MHRSAHHIKRDNTAIVATKAGSMAEVYPKNALERSITRVGLVAPARKELGATVSAGEPMGVTEGQGQAFSHLTSHRIRRDSLI